MGNHCGVVGVPQNLKWGVEKKAKVMRGGGHKTKLENPPDGVIKHSDPLPIWHDLEKNLNFHPNLLNFLYNMQKDSSEWVRKCALGPKKLKYPICFVELVELSNLVENLCIFNFQF